MRCGRCGSENKVKRGFYKKKEELKQKYLCKDCGYNYSQAGKLGKPESMKRLALQLYCEGLGIRGISRVVGVSAVSVLNWIRKSGELLLKQQEIANNIKCEVIELDELHHYIQKKVIQSGYGLRLIAPVNQSLTSFVVIGQVKVLKS